MTPSQIAKLSLRFACLYALLVFASSRIPLFPRLEEAAVFVVDLAYRGGAHAGASRSLELARAGDDWVYRFTVETQAGLARIQQRYHPHGYVLILFAALVLATPDIGWRSRALSLAAGGALVFGYGVGLLASDLQGWERALAAGGAAPASLRWATPLGWLAALHRTAGSALVPLMLWGFAAHVLVGSRAQAPPRDGAR